MRFFYGYNDISFYKFYKILAVKALGELIALEISVRFTRSPLLDFIVINIKDRIPYSQVLENMFLLLLEYYNYKGQNYPNYDEYHIFRQFCPLILAYQQEGPFDHYHTNVN